MRPSLHIVLAEGPGPERRNLTLLVILIIAVAIVPAVVPVSTPATANTLSPRHRSHAGGTQICASCTIGLLNATTFIIQNILNLSKYTISAFLRKFSSAIEKLADSLKTRSDPSTKDRIVYRFKEFFWGLIMDAIGESVKEEIKLFSKFLITELFKNIVGRVGEVSLVLTNFTSNASQSMTSGIWDVLSDQGPKLLKIVISSSFEVGDRGWTRLVGRLAELLEELNARWEKVKGIWFIVSNFWSLMERIVPGFGAEVVAAILVASAWYFEQVQSVRDVFLAIRDLIDKIVGLVASFRRVAQRVCLCSGINSSCKQCRTRIYLQAKGRELELKYWE